MVMGVQSRPPTRSIIEHLRRRTGHHVLQRLDADGERGRIETETLHLERRLALIWPVNGVETVACHGI